MARWLDKYLDGYLARKIVSLVESHCHDYPVVSSYNPGLEVYDIDLVEGSFDYTLMSFSRKDSLITLRNLLSRGWGILDERLASGVRALEEYKKQRGDSC